MGKQFLSVICTVFCICMPVLVVGAETQPSAYSETFLQSAFQQTDTSSAVTILLDANVPISAIVSAAIQSGVSDDAIVSALLAAGISPQKIILLCRQGPMSFQGALNAFNNHGISPDKVLAWLIKWDLGMDGLYETCAFMLNQGFSKADILIILRDAEADREIVIQVVRWFEIPPATVVAVYQSFLDYFGHVFNRESLPQPALLAIGVARIPIDDPCCRPVISPMIP